MTIGIDGHDLEGNRTGVGRYLVSILRAWERQGVFANERVIVFFKTEIPGDLPQGTEPRLLRSPLGRPSNALFIHWFLPRAAKRAGVDVLWCPGYVAPIWLPRTKKISSFRDRAPAPAKKSVASPSGHGVPTERRDERGRASSDIFLAGENGASFRGGRGVRIPLVLTLHDIIYEARPDLFNWRGPQDRFLLKFVSKRAAKRAARILAPSQFTAREIERLYRVPPERIAVTPEAADASFRPIPDRSQARATAQRYGVTGPYLFFVGSIFTRRYLPECIRAFSRVAADVPDAQFLIAGRNLTKPRVNLVTLIAEANTKLRRLAIIWKPYAAAKDLPALYNAAEALVWLSLYEGFGLPPLEALACGTPVATTKRSALPETVGDCALFVENPKDTAEIASAMRTLFTDRAIRQRFASCGPQRAAQFSWEQCAEQTLSALRETAQSGNAKIPASAEAPSFGKPSAGKSAGKQNPNAK